MCEGNEQTRRNSKPLVCAGYGTCISFTNLDEERNSSSAKRKGKRARSPDQRENSVMQPDIDRREYYSFYFVCCVYYHDSRYSTESDNP